MPSPFLTVGAGAVKGLDSILDRAMDQQRLDDARREAELRRLEVERSNRAQEGLRTRELGRLTANDAYDVKRQTETDAEAKTQHDFTEAGALGDQIPAGTEMMPDDPAVGTMQRGGRSSLLSPHMAATKIGGNVGSPDSGPAGSAPLTFEPIAAGVTKNASDIQNDRAADNARQAASAGGGGSDFDKYVATKEKELGHPLSSKEIEGARKSYMQADDRPFAPVVIQTGNGPQTLDRSAGTTRVITGPDGKPVEPAQTAEMRNRQAARNGLGIGIKQVEDLSGKLINQRGLAQRATAAGRSIDSALGNDPEYKVYKDARFALAANLAVAQQGSRPSDADVMKGWLPLIPDVFSDTDQSAAMKWDMIRKLAQIEAGTDDHSRGPNPDDDFYQQYLNQHKQP